MSESEDREISALHVRFVIVGRRRAVDDAPKRHIFDTDVTSA